MSFVGIALVVVVKKDWKVGWNVVQRRGRKDGLRPFFPPSMGRLMVK